MLVPEEKRYTAKQVLDHVWSKNEPDNPLNQLGFTINFFVDYTQDSNMKKISLIFISSRLVENETNNLKKVFTAFDKGKMDKIVMGI